MCIEHATCGECHIQLANGELQRALAIAGGMNPARVRALIREKKWDWRASKEVEEAVARGISALAHLPYLRLWHAPGDQCGSSLFSTPVPSRADIPASLSHDRPPLLA